MREKESEEGEWVRQDSWRVGGKGKEQAGQSQREEVTEPRMRPVVRRQPPICIPLYVFP